MDQANVTRFDRWMVTLAAALLVGVYSFRGGTFDIVARHQAAIALWGVVLLAVGTGIAIRRPGPRALLLPVLCLLLLMGWTALSLLWTSSAERTLAEVARVAHYAGLLLVVRAAVTRVNWTGAAAGATAAAVVVCLLAIVSRLQPGWFPADETAELLGVRRLGYPFGYWNALGAWAAMTAAVSLAWSAHAKHLATRMAAAAALPICGLAGYLTYSRAGILDIALGVIVVVALARNRWTVALNVGVALPATLIAVTAARGAPEVALGEGTAGAAGLALLLAASCLVAAIGPLVGWRIRADRLRLPRTRARQTLGLATALIAVFVLVTGVAKGPDAWDEFRTTDSAAINDPAARLTSFSGARYALWSEAAELGGGHPIKGIGAGTFEFAWSRDNPAGGFERDAHSLYLEHFGELGIPGVVLLLAALGSLLLVLLRSRRQIDEARDFGVHAGCTAAFVVFLFHAGVDWMWESTAVTVLALLLAAVGTAPSLEYTFSRLRTAPRIAGGVLAVVLIAVQLPGLASTQRVRESREAFAAGRVDDAVGSANAAIRAQPWAATPYTQRAGVAESTGDLASAARDLQRSIEREPLNWRHPLLLARVEANRGNTEAALRAFRRAKQLRPRSAFYEDP